MSNQGKAKQELAGVQGCLIINITKKKGLFCTCKSKFKEDSSGETKSRVLQVFFFQIFYIGYLIVMTDRQLSGFKKTKII